MSLIETLIVPVIVIVISTLIATAIIEALKAPIRKYLRKRHQKHGETSLPQARPGKQDRDKEPKMKEIEEILLVEPGCYVTKSFRFKKGDRISGLATETSSSDFNMYVLDKEGYADYVNDDNFDSLLERKGVVAAPFDLLIPKSGKWYFVFDIYRRQYSREIEFECTIHSS